MISPVERQSLEARYVADLIQVLRERGGALSPPLMLERHTVAGSWPDSVLTIYFHVPAYAACLYAVDDRLWDEDPIAAFGVDGADTYTWLRIQELVEALPRELPSECDPDESGATRVPLWG